MTKNVICRVCLEENSLLYDIFEVTIVDKDDNEFTISDVLAIYCSIQVIIAKNCIKYCNKYLKQRK